MPHNNPKPPKGRLYKANEVPQAERLDDGRFQVRFETLGITGSGSTEQDAYSDLGRQLSEILNSWSESERAAWIAEQAHPHDHAAGDHQVG